MKTKYYIAIFGVLALLCAAASLLLLVPGEQATRAEVWSDGEYMCTLDLLKNQTFTVESENGVNVITVSGGKVAVTQADCPDHYCMQRGYCNSGAQIVCLPNRLVIQFVGPREVDAVVG